MSVWTTRTQPGDKSYIVLQHTLRGVNHTVNGIKFRDGYCVVEKDSKAYLGLKKIPVLKASREYPLTHLRKLPFITRTSDIRTVYGQDVYIKFLEEEEKTKKLLEKKKEDDREQQLKTKQELEVQLEQAVQKEDIVVAEQIKAAIPDITKCCNRTQDGTLCKYDSAEHSPSGYCDHHLMNDPKIGDFVEGFEIPKFMTREERQAFKNKTRSALKRAKDKGKF